MNIYPQLLKDKLFSLIREMAASPELFVKNPGKDFTRNRKLPLETMLFLLVSMGGGGLHKELLDGLGFNADIPTSSAFVQQRGKILHSALEYLMHEFNANLGNTKTFRGYRLIAGDGSNITFTTDPLCPDTFIRTNPDSKGYNSMHLTVLYDLCNRTYLDACVQNIRDLNEKRAFTDMVDRSGIHGNVIVVADRNFEGYNIFAHIGEKGWNYIIRVKNQNGGIVSGLNLPRSGEFDIHVNRLLTRRNTMEVKNNPETYKHLSSRSTFDFIVKGVNEFFPISFRVVRFTLDDGSFETVITNLDADAFPPSELKRIYRMRWGVETSFRELKHTIGLTNFHSKKQGGILQEIFARIIMYNFVETIASRIIISQADKKYAYKINFTVAVLVCRHFLRSWYNAPPDVEALIMKHTVPIRPDRHIPRDIRSKSAVSFTYRIA